MKTEIGKIAELQNYNFFGHQEIIEETCRDGTAVATQDTNLLFIDAFSFNNQLMHLKDKFKDFKNSWG